MGVCSRGCLPMGVYTPPPVNRMTDRCKKHYLSATSFADGKNIQLAKRLALSTIKYNKSRGTVKENGQFPQNIQTIDLID